MNDSSSNIPDEKSQSSPGNDTQNIPEDASSEITSDGIFAIKVSEDMKLRNALRSGLVEAQGRDTDKIPMYVSWPHWLEDGIVCLFAKDFHQVLHNAVQDTAITLGKTFEVKDLDIEPVSFLEEQNREIETLPEIESEEIKEESEDGTTIEAEQETEEEKVEVDNEQETTGKEEENKKTTDTKKNPGQDLSNQLFLPHLKMNKRNN